MTLRLNNWRCFESVHFELPNESLILCDQNGSGKTSLLAAVYSLLTGNPWPETKFQNSLKAGQEYFGLEFERHSSWYLSGKINPSGRLTTKYEIPDQPHLYFLSENFDEALTLDDLKVLTYLPSDNSWLFESRTKKLKILDELLGQIYQTPYQTALKKLNQSNLQKQKLIKHSREQESPVDRTLLNTLSQEIFRQSQTIWDYRSQFFFQLNEQLPKFEAWIEGKLNHWQVRWEITGEYSHRQKVASFATPKKEPHWSSILEREIASEKILYGAHRDDFNLVSQHLECQDIFSRGEMRSLVLFIKNLAQNLNPKPATIWLVDDIFNELDEKREQTIFGEILKEADWFLASSTQKVEALPTQHLRVKDLDKTGLISH